MIEFVQPRIYAYPQAFESGKVTLWRFEVHVYMQGGTCVGAGNSISEALENVAVQTLGKGSPAQHAKLGERQSA